MAGKVAGRIVGKLTVAVLVTAGVLLWLAYAFASAPAAGDTCSRGDVFRILETRDGVVLQCRYTAGVEREPEWVATGEVGRPPENDLWPVVGVGVLAISVGVGGVVWARRRHGRVNPHHRRHGAA